MNKWDILPYFNTDYSLVSFEVAMECFMSVCRRMFAGVTFLNLSI